MTAPIRWGILGTGDIARQFADDLKLAPSAVLHAVGSRRQDTAQRFAAAHGIPHAFDSYEALVANSGVDAVYIGTPHTSHLENTLLCLRAGKAVLCEKPMGVNEQQVQAMLDEAAARSLFLMEAMWTWFFPVFSRVRSLIHEGAIGEVRLVTGHFCFTTEFEPHGRLFDPAFAGGALLDVGIYPIALADWVYESEPEAVEGLAHLGPTGVDEVNGMTLRYPGGGLAVLSSAVQLYRPEDALIAGTEGFIRIRPPFYQPDAFTLTRNGEEETFAFEREGLGYHHEAQHVGECLRRGLTESPTVTHAASLRFVRTMDRLRARWGLQYPADHA